jgi:O-antigen/teichoic acid export membrane protein
MLNSNQQNIDQTTMEVSLKKRYFFKLMTNFVGLGIGLITQSIVPRALGPASYGNFSFLTSFFWQVIGFLNLNSSTAFYSKLSQRQQDKGLISFYFYITLLIGFLLVVFIVACYLVGIDQLIWPGQIGIFVVMAATFSFLQLYYNALIHVSDAYGLTTKSEVLNMSQRVLGLVIIVFLFWVNGITLLNYFIFQLFMSITIIVFICIMIQRYKAPLIAHWHLNKDQLKAYIKEFASFCLPLVIFSFFAILEQMLDRWFLQKFSGSTQQGFYSLAYQIGTLCFLFVSAMIPLIMREYAISFAKNDIENMRQLFSKYSKILFAIAAFFGCFLAVEAKEVMLIFGGQAFTGAILPITIMCFYPIHQTYGQMNGAFFLRPAELRLIAI